MKRSASAAGIVAVVVAAKYRQKLITAENVFVRMTVSELGAVAPESREGERNAN